MAATTQRPAGQFTLIKKDETLEQKGRFRRNSMIQLEDKQKELDRILRESTKPYLDEVEQAKKRVEQALQEYDAKKQRFIQKAKTVAETNQAFKKTHREYETLASAHPQIEEEFRREVTRYISDMQQMLEKNKTLSEKDKRKARDEIIQYLKTTKTPAEIAFIDQVTERLGKGDGIIVISAACAAPDDASAVKDGPAGLFLH